MSRSLLVGVAAIAVATLVPQTPVMAQDDASIVVSTPRLPRAEPQDGVQQRIQLVAQVSVYTDDLNLRTAYGRDVLNRRVQLAAVEACDRLDGADDGIGPVNGRHTQDCRIRAAQDAHDQVRAAILAS